MEATQASLSEIREQLLSQHRELRELATEVEVLLGQDLQRQGAALVLTLGRLARLLHQHNHFEESHLRDVLPTLDAWGPQRASLMDEHHHAQHRAMEQALHAVAASQDLAAVAPQVRGTLHDLREHMAREEKELVHPSVLRDDVVSVDSMGG